MKSIISGTKNPDQSFSFRGSKASLFVGGVWLIMMLIALTCLVAYGRNIPLAEDWVLVAPLTGNEPDLWGWLWSQNNEHRIPLPRLILLGLLTLTKGNFRVGMLFNILILGGLSFILIWVARSLREGQTKYVDAFFPLAFLHLGHWPNLYWNWQLTQILPTVIVCLFLPILLDQPLLKTPITALMAGIGLILLPLCGANGLLYTPFLAIWLIYCGIRQMKTKEILAIMSPWIAYFLIASALVSFLLVGVYFIGYESPSWNPPNPGIISTLATTAKFFAYGFGPSAANFWSIFVFAAFAYLLPSFVILVKGILINKDNEKQRALVVLWLVGMLFVFALAIGYGRAGSVPTEGFPIRYALFSVPLFCTCFFAWELYGNPHIKALFQQGLLILMLLLLPFNMITGFTMFGNWYDRGMNAIEQDIVEGRTGLEIAQRHRDFLVHWWDDEKLANHIQMLYEHRIVPFSNLQKN